MLDGCILDGYVGWVCWMGVCWMGMLDGYVGWVCSVQARGHIVLHMEGRKHEPTTTSTGQEGKTRASSVGWHVSCKGGGELHQQSGRDA